MLKKRFITAIFLILFAVYLIIFANPFIFKWLTEIIILLAAWEWCNLINICEWKKRFVYLVVVAASMVFVFCIPVFYFLSAVFCFWIIALFLILLYPRAKSYWNSSVILRSILGLFTLVPAWYSVVFIQTVVAGGKWMLIFLMLLVWSADIGAYFAGRMWGNKKMLPEVSPNKTWVGFGGGLLLSMSVAFMSILAFSHFFGIGLSPFNALALLGVSLVSVVFSVVGDFFESMLKREAGIKDSGTIFPGHGGLLDRIDSLTAAAPIFLFGLLLIKF